MENETIRLTCPIVEVAMIGVPINSFNAKRPWLLCTLAVTLVVAACAASTTVTGGWQVSRPSTAPFNHILVVGISPNSRNRRSFEQALAASISAGGSSASASIQLGDAAQPLTPEIVGDMGRTSGADAVLVTRLVNRKVAQEETGGRVGVKTEQVSSLSEGPGLVELFSVTYNEYEEPGELTTMSTIVLNSSVYLTADGGRMVYTLVTTSHFTENRDDAIGNVTSAIAAKLRRDGLIR